MAKSSKTLKLPAVEGELVVWGGNERLQITEAPKSRGAFWKVAQGGATQCLAIRMNGSPALWGNGPMPPTGETPGDRQGVPLPLQLPPGGRYIDAALGLTHAYFLRSNGRIDPAGKFAVTNASADVPVALLGVRFVAVSAGGGFGVAIDVDGRLHQWGSLPEIAAQEQVKFTKIRGRNGYCLALDEGGHLWAWGEGAVLSAASLPGWQLRNSGFQTRGYWFHPGKFVDIAAGAEGKNPSYPAHILAIRDTGTIAAWGEDRFGQVSGAPKAIGSTTLGGKRTRFQAVAAGQGYSLALDENGYIYHWGLTGSASTPTGLSNVPQGQFASIGAGTMQATAVRPNRSPPLFSLRDG